MMADKYAFGAETENYARLSLMLVDVVADVLRDVLSIHTPPPGLHVILQSQKHHIRKTLPSHVLSVLYPPGSVFSGTLKDLDVHILFLLIRNLQGINISPHTTGWGRTPDSQDRSLAANIDRLRVIRNENANPRTTLISDSEFRRIGGIIRQCISEIEQTSLTGDIYVRAVDSLLSTKQVAPRYTKYPTKEFSFVGQTTIYTRESITARQGQHRFLHTIDETEDILCNITIAVVGHKGVGKTCFVSQIKKEYIPKGGPASTNSADFYVNFMAYDPDTGVRKNLNEEGEMDTGRHRLKQLFDRYRVNSDTGTEQETVTRSMPSPSSSSAPSTDDQQKRQLSSFETKKDMQLSLDQKSFINEILFTNIEENEELMKGFISIYDFGGEKVFYNTTHSFMSSNMIFVLVFDVAMCRDPKTSKEGYESIENWLRSIATYAIDPQAGSNEGTPPIILVGSHLDLVSDDVKKQKEAFLEVLERLYGNPQLEKIMETHVQEVYPVANLDDSSKNQHFYEELWDQIIKIAPLQSQWRKPIPGRWLALGHQLLIRKNKGALILTYDELLEINSNSAVPLTDGELLDFLKHLTFSASFLCIGLSSNKPFIVLKHQWVIDAFKAIITAPDFTKHLPGKLYLQWRQYEKSGKIKLAFIRQLWQHYEPNSFLPNEKTLCVVMETLGLLARPFSDNQDEDIEYFIVPCMLGPAEPGVIQPILDDPDTVITVTLCLEFNNPFIPEAVWDKLIAVCIHKFQRLHERGHDGLKFIQRGFVCLSIDSLWNMIIHCKGNIMKITMFKRDTNTSVPIGSGVNLLSDLEAYLGKVLELNHQGHLGYRFYLHNSYCFTEDDKMVKVEELQRNERLPCHSANERRMIGREKLYIWFKCPEQKSSVNETKIKEIHSAMIRKLSEWIDPSLPKYWRPFQTAMEPYLSHRQIFGEHVKCLDDICIELMNKKDVDFDYGKYDILRSAVVMINAAPAAEIIVKALSEIDRTKHDGTGQPL